MSAPNGRHRHVGEFLLMEPMRTGRLLLDVRSSSGALELMTDGSTKPVVTTITHAGIITVLRYEATAPRDPIR
jgi:hypothetical protein